MKKFCVLLCTETSINFVPSQAEYSFVLGDKEITFRKINERDKMITDLNYGLMIQVILFKKDIDKAIKSANELTEFFLSVFCLESGVEVYKARTILAYDITEENNKRVFRQYFYNLPFSTPNEIEYDLFLNDFKEIWNYNGKYSNRIARSARWFRKAIIGDDPLDQFLFFWHGLESLNSALAEEFDIEKSIQKEIKRKCKKCEEEYKDTITTKGGIEALYDDLNIEESVRKKINNIRNGISHGYENITNLYSPTLKILPIISEILYKGIIKVLGLSIDQNSLSRLKNVSPIGVGDVHYIEVYLLEKELEKIRDDNYYPFFDVELKYHQKKNGYKITTECEPQFNCGYEPHGIASSGKNINMEITESN